MLYWYTFAAISFVILMLVRNYSISKRPCLRVLMYHKISEDGYNDYLTVPVKDLEKQFNYLLTEGYTPVLLSDLVNYVELGKALPRKPVLITFDDGYRDNFTVMYPLLKKYGIKANIFLVPSFIQHNQFEQTALHSDYLHVNDIHTMDARIVEYGLHSYDHKNFRTLSSGQIAQDIAKSRALLNVMNIEFQPCLAFPYGAFPKRNPVKLKELFYTLSANDMVLAFRIGNRLNPLPLKNPLLVQRLDIRGNDPFEKFIKLLKKGKPWI